MNKWLLSAGFITALISILHIGIVIGGAEWYIFFGAGSEMAKQSEAGMIEPAITTLGIAFILGLVSLFTFIAAKRKGKLPMINFLLYGFAVVMIIRGLVGLPLVYLVAHPYFNELAARPLFMIVSSLFCLSLGSIYLVGLKNRRSRNPYR